ncbi:YifB family Mg chelatase-like AAA ATPase [Corynebacterium sp. MNWGS58]|uniref:YifB family Mg chelatase-like AAA ATPase n=1 Tax=Corynebacterium sp. 102791.4 TaxID=3104612 RepID=UPI003516DD55
MLAKTHTVALSGVHADIVTVEANIGPGLPGIHVVGLGDAAVNESRDRIRTAVANTHLRWPKTKIVVSMSPAGLPKSGSHFDLPTALAVLEAADNADSRSQRDLDATVVLGELGLDGRVRAVAGIVPALLAARRYNFQTVIIPPANAAEAALIDDMDVLVAPTLSAAYHWMRGRADLAPAADYRGQQESYAPPQLDFADIAGQREAIRAAEIAATGGHHLLMIGPPGSGKSMIAARIPGIMPELSTTQALEISAVHSVLGTGSAPRSVITQPPYIAPHHSITRAGLLGGGSGNPRPGAVSLAHHGVLFLDEISEMPAAIVDSLRTPLEQGEVRLVRNRREIVFPARCQLVLAANPCRCAAENAEKCRCRAHERMRYLNNLSGPMRDRLDITVHTHTQTATLIAENARSSAEIAESVAEARQRGAYRWTKAGIAESTNAAVPTTLLRREFAADPAGMALLQAHLSNGDITQRAVDKVLKLAWTLCDLDGSSTPGLGHIAQAIEVRGDMTRLQHQEVAV